MGFLYRHFIGGEETLLEEVVRNIRYLLASKRGASSFLPHFGVTESGFRTAEEMVTVLGVEIRENLERYEPRVEVIEISEEYEDDDPRPHIAVHCRLRTTGERVTLHLEPRSQTVRAALPPSTGGAGA